MTLAWSASTDNVGVTKYRVRRGGTVIAEPTAASYTDTGLTNGTAYAYTVSAVDAAGNESAQSSSVSATPTGTPDTTAPTVPTNLAAGTPTASSVPLSWTASTDAVGVTGYRIYNGTTLLSSVTGTSTTLTGLSPSTTYALSVSAIDAAGNESAKSTAVSVTTSAAASMTVITSDSFTGGDAATVEGRTTDAALGGSGKTYSTTTTDATLAIVSGNLRKGSAAVTNAALISLPSADQRLAVTIVALPTGASIFLPVRRSGLPTGTSYRAVIGIASSGVSTVTLARTNSSNTNTNLTTTTTIVAGDRIEVSAVGSAISLYKNGTLIGSDTDTTVTTGSYAGISISGAATAWQLDDVVWSAVA